MSPLFEGLSENLSSISNSPRQTRQRNELGHLLWPADVVVCTHAHADHARGLRSLQQHYPELPIYSSAVTSRLLSLQWLGESGFPNVRAVEWRSPTEICPNLMLQLWPAGHLPGAACVLLTYDGSGTDGNAAKASKQRRQRVFYTGDCMVSSSRLVDGMPLSELSGLKPDVLIIDGSYGMARSARRKEQETQLAEVILRAIAQNRSVVLPTPRLGLGQELLMLFRSHHHFTGQDIDIWVSPSLAAGCDAYLDLVDDFPASVQNFARHQSLFLDDRILPHVYRLNNQNPDTLSEIAHNTPSIFLIEAPVTPDFFLAEISAATANRWLILLPQHPDKDTYQTFISYLQANHQIHDAVNTGLIQPFPYSLGSHCDGPVTMQVIHSIRPQHLILVHGKPHFLLDLASQEELQTRYQIHLPTKNTHIELPVGDRFIQPEPPSLNYRGELTTLQTTVLLTLDSSIQDDVRWQHFADTGLIEAQWQGNDLLIRGVPASNIIRDIQRDSPFPINCCEYCSYYRDQRCWNNESSLFGFQVTPEGSCPVFESFEPI